MARWMDGDNLSIEKETCPNVTLSTTNPIWKSPRSNPSLRAVKPATLSQGHGLPTHLHENQSIILRQFEIILVSFKKIPKIVIR
jgi:hypothetical protein